MSLLTSAANSQPQQVVLKVHHPLSATSNIATNVIQAWCDKINKQSGDQLKCQIYPSMTLGGTPNQLFDQARDGVADIVWTIPSYTAGRFTKSEVFELPFFTRTAKGSSEAFWRYVQDNAIDEYKGVKPLLLHTSDGAALMLASEKGVKSMEDLKGLKIRAPSRQATRMLTALGAAPIQMPLPSVTEGMSKGVIDGAMLTWEIAPAVKFQEVTRSVLDVPANQPRFLNAIFILGMSQARYDSLSADLKRVIDANSGAAASAWAGEACCNEAVVASAKKLFSDQRVSMTTLGEGEYARWRKASAGVYDQWISDVNAKGGNGAALLKRAQALTQQLDR